jgi:hypothetical protein
MTAIPTDSLVHDARDWAGPLLRMRAAFLGCGDSLAAARPAENDGHRVISAGDVAWTGLAPRGVDVSIALSWSGRTGATIRAAETARSRGQVVWAITSNPDSPLAQLADRHLALPNDPRSEEIPTWGFALHSVAVHTLLGHTIDLDAVLDAATDLGEAPEAVAGAQAPSSISVGHLPDSHSTAEFWSLKLIEATGVAARVVPLEELGHVDYFIGPQPHLTLIPVIGSGHQRARRLGDALRRNGQTVVEIDLRSRQAELNDHEFALALSLAGGQFAAAAARAWGRPPFRGGQVDMSAQHIQVPSE